MNRVVHSKDMDFGENRTKTNFQNFRNVLKNINFKVKRGEKICVIGRRGCGGKELFLALMNEI